MVIAGQYWMDRDVNCCIEHGRMQAVVLGTEGYDVSNHARITEPIPNALGNISVSTSDLCENLDMTIGSAGNMACLDTAIHGSELRKRAHSLVETCEARHQQTLKPFFPHITYHSCRLPSFCCEEIRGQQLGSLFDRSARATNNLWHGAGYTVFMFHSQE